VVEMLSGNPPWHEFEGIAAIYLIGTSAKPKYQLLDRVSNDARNFLERCFIRDPHQRPSAAELLSDPFVRDTAASLDHGRKVEDRSQKVENTAQEIAGAMGRLSADKLEGAPSLAQQRQQTVEREARDAQTAKKSESTHVTYYGEKVFSMRTQDSVHEEAEKNKRKTNVIVHGLPESRAEDSVERERDDLEMVRTMLHAMKCDDVEVGQVVRLGKRRESASGSDSQKPRSLKLVLRTEDQRTQVLKSAKNLRREGEGVWKGVHIDADLTVSEREAWKVSEVKQRKEDGETNLVITEGIIVKKWCITRTAQD